MKNDALAGIAFLKKGERNMKKNLSEHHCPRLEEQAG
jgi:hypothetical protein